MLTPHCAATAYRSAACGSRAPRGSRRTVAGGSVSPPATTSPIYRLRCGVDWLRAAVALVHGSLCRYQRRTRRLPPFLAWNPKWAAATFVRHNFNYDTITLGTLEVGIDICINDGTTACVVIVKEPLVKISLCCHQKNAV